MLWILKYGTDYTFVQRMDLHWLLASAFQQPQLKLNQTKIKVESKQGEIKEWRIRIYIRSTVRQHLSSLWPYEFSARTVYSPSSSFLARVIRNSYARPEYLGMCLRPAWSTCCWKDHVMTGVDDATTRHLKFPTCPSPTMQLCGLRIKRGAASFRSEENSKSNKRNI